MTNNIIVDLSMDFSIAIVTLCDAIKGKAGMLIPFQSMREDDTAGFVDYPIRFKWNLSVEEEE